MSASEKQTFLHRDNAVLYTRGDDDEFQVVILSDRSRDTNNTGPRGHPGSASGFGGASGAVGKRNRGNDSPSVLRREEVCINIMPNECNVLLRREDVLVRPRNEYATSVKCDPHVEQSLSENPKRKIVLHRQDSEAWNWLTTLISRMNARATIHDMPDELLERILLETTRVDHEAQYSSIPLVCKHWRNVVSGDTFKKMAGKRRRPIIFRPAVHEHNSFCSNIPWQSMWSTTTCLLCLVILIFIVTSIVCNVILIMQLKDKLLFAEKNFGGEIIHYYPIHMGFDIFTNIVYAIDVLAILFKRGGCIECGCCNKLLLVLIVIILFVMPAQKLFSGLQMRNTGIDEEKMIKLLREYGQSQSTKTVDAWDSIHEEFSCCGIHSPFDWAANPSFSPTMSLPDSCCVHQTKGCGTFALSFSFGISELTVHGDDDNTYEPHPMHPGGCFNIDSLTSMFLDLFFGVDMALVATSLAFLLSLIYDARANR